MPDFQVTAPDGRTLVLTGNSPPTEAELEDIFSQSPGLLQQTQTAVLSLPQATDADFLASILSMAVAEPAAGVAGLATSLIPGLEPGAGAGVTEGVRERLIREPVTPGAQERFQEIGEFFGSEPMQAGTEKIDEAIIAGGNVLGAIFNIDPALAQTVLKVTPIAAMEAIPLAPLVRARGITRIRGISDTEAVKLADQGLTVDDLSPQGVQKIQQQSIQETKQVVDDAVRQAGPEGLVVRDASGQFTPEAIDALKNLQGKRVLTPEEAETFNLFQRRQIPATAADITGATDLQRLQQEALKRTGPVSEFVAGQETALTGAVGRQIEQLKPSANTLQEANTRVFTAIDDFIQESEGVINQAYQAARVEAKGQPLVVLDDTLTTLNRLKGPKLNKPVTSELQSIIKNRKIIEKDRLREITVDEAEAIRQEMNLLFDSVTPQGRRTLKDIKDSIDKDVSDVVGSDVFAEARRLNTEFNNKISRAKRNRKDTRAKGFLEKIIDNTIPETEIINKIRTVRADDINELKAFLTQESGPNGIQAWNDLKAQVIRDGLNKATSTLGKAEGGVPKFNVNKFETQFKVLRDKGTMDIIFTPDEIQFIDDIIKIGRKRTPQQLVQAGEGPTSFAVRQALTQIPGGKAVETVTKFREFLTEGRLLDPIGPTEKALAR